MDHNYTKRYNPSDDMDTYTLDDWREVSQSTLSISVLIQYYKQVDWMFYSIHTNVSELKLPDEIMNYIVDDVRVGENIRNEFDEIL